MGTLHGIGVGPGDPELLTVKGLRLIRAATVVFVPAARAGAPSYAATIAGMWLDPTRQQVIELEYPVGPEVARWREAWAANADCIAARLAGDTHGVFLTEGDPLLYSTFIHTLEALRARHPRVTVAVVPGVPSFTAAAAAALTPLATGSDRIAIIPASCDPLVIRAALRDHETVVLLKVSAAFDAVLDALDAEGRTGQAVWVRRAGRPEQAIERDVRRLRGTRPDYFSLVIVRREASGQPSAVSSQETASGVVGGCARTVTAAAAQGADAGG